ncbi:hypothetical protein [Hymenobacter volaticus]|uniref:Uncharacterized protein n=1 Tax=Hymenobacter volaticus TaxID=2932254 RepID=A0ABY4GE30_9BACT|nr:hypothetical protein [Hymenobacter volaticus]UOQ69007.1 hypothetical protein MUN86_26240 [Hymenobacter volaticus]
MKFHFPFLLIGVLLLAAALPTRAQSAVAIHADLDFEVSKQKGAWCDPSSEYLDPTLAYLFAKYQAMTPAPTTEPQLLPPAENQQLALDYRIGLLQAQVELLSRRLAALEATPTTAATEGDSGQPR